MSESPVAIFVPARITQVAAWPETLPRVSAALAAALDGGTLPSPGSMAAAGSVDSLTLAPGRFLLIDHVGHLGAGTARALPPEDAAVTDLSHARLCARLSGPKAQAVLESGARIDLSPDAFPVGRVAQTMLEHFDVTLMRREPEVFDLLVLSSYGDDAVAWLKDACIGK